MTGWPLLGTPSGCVAVNPAVINETVEAARTFLESHPNARLTETEIGEVTGASPLKKRSGKGRLGAVQRDRYRSLGEPWKPPSGGGPTRIGVRLIWSLERVTQGQRRVEHQLSREAWKVGVIWERSAEVVRPCLVPLDQGHRCGHA